MCVTANNTSLPPSAASLSPEAYNLESDIPIYTTVASYREWRRKAFVENRSVGFVPTMGALHEGHLDLVRKSLSENDLTVLSIFVNPAQFSPHEDLETYPRTLEHDLKLLAQQQQQQHILLSNTPNTHSTSTITGGQPSHIRRPSAVFLPSVSEMYPHGISQDARQQRGTFVEVKGYADEQMEGKSRPGFFRGVATVVTKLFNVIQPTNAYFGQKDIQQALLLRRMVADLLLSHPSAQNLHIVPTVRDPLDNLALSSRNTYLSPSGRKVAPTLYNALKAAEHCWFLKKKSKKECVDAAREVILHRVRDTELGTLDGVEIKMDYVEMNDAEDFKVLEDEVTLQSRGEDASTVILSGAMWVNGTRLIDNLLLGDLGQGK
ncbi:pantothenate synthetase [Lentinula novae-zelandiae]|nr:pantothenate synthetase [Lentinula novae-zelandiae]